MIGTSQIKLKWDNTLIATWLSTIECGPFIISSFYTKDGGGRQPLDIEIFLFDSAAWTLTIKSTDLKKAGTYEIYYEVSLRDYLSAKKSS